MVTFPSKVKAAPADEGRGVTSPVATTVEDLFDSIVDSEISKPGVSTGTGFGTNKGLRTSGKIYAILVRGQLVVSCPGNESIV